MAIDHSAGADEVDNFNDLTLEQKAKARRTVASFSADADECREFFAMLGISAAQTRDVVPEVNRPKLPNAPKNHRSKRM